MSKQRPSKVESEMADELARKLHEATSEGMERMLTDIALEQTEANHGALFLWDSKVRGLCLAHHVVDGVTVTLPNRILTKGAERAGIAMAAFTANASYLCVDTAEDPNYTRYLVDVGTIAAAPIRYQGRSIGVLTVSARRKGAFTEETLRVLERITLAASPFLRRVQLDRQSQEETGRPFLIKGLSPLWNEVESRIELASPTNAPILVRGESGTGKDLVARAIHFNSKRSDKPFVAVNCAAIPETLLESSLFGHVKGAFTGASFQKVGEFQKADGGTLFLDEVGELPLALQAKVLRAVEQGEVQPLGSNEPPMRVDVRLICATNRNLESMVRKGEFRDDLFYRLTVMPLALPALRSYKDNLRVLANVFLEQSARSHGKEAPRISEAAMQLLEAHDFPGNVRELKNSIEHAMILCTGVEILPEHLPAAFGATQRSSVSQRSSRQRRSLKDMREEWLAPLERSYLVELLRDCDGNVRRAAELADVNHVTFYRLLRKHGITLGREVRTES